MREFVVRVDDADDTARALLDALAARGDVEAFDAPSGRVLVLGGARSGKSTWAEAQFADRTIDYVATSLSDGSDPEWAERVRLHRERRPAHWRTIETLDLPAVLAHDGPPVLIDCLAVWLARTLDDVGAWTDSPGWRQELEASVDALADAVAATSREVILVTNEVGSGVVPATVSGRIYRDELGRLNAAVASRCDQVWQVIAGIPRRLR